MSLFESVIANTLPRLVGVAGSQRLSILNYHQILSEPDWLRQGAPTVTEFDWHMGLIAKYFRPISLLEAAVALDKGCLPERSVCVTFDDGYADNYIRALPVLKKWGVPATVFVASGFVDGGTMWNDAIIESISQFDGDAISVAELGLEALPMTSVRERVEACGKILNGAKYLSVGDRDNFVKSFVKKQRSVIPENLMLNMSQLRGLHSEGVTIGAHTVSHPILEEMADDEAKREIVEGKRWLEEAVDSEVTCFAYPNGVPGRDFSKRHREMVKMAGFSVAVTTSKGVAGNHSDLLSLPRFTPWDKSPLKFLARLIINQRALINNQQ